MNMKTFIVKHTKGAEVARIIEAKSRRAVENAILEDYDIQGVNGRNVGEVMRLTRAGVKAEKIEG